MKFVKYEVFVEQYLLGILDVSVIKHSFFSSFTTVFNGPTTSHKVSKLHERTEYQFRIQASNDAGAGPFSDATSFVTTAQPPNTVKG